MSSQNPQYKSSKIISKLFPNPVFGQILPIDDYLAKLTAEEFEIVRHASNKRKLEFSTGRWCAKQAFADQSLHEPIILSGINREPIWPKGYIGSISHCKDQCGAVVAETKKIKSIGFDVETIKILKNNIAKVVCTDIEKQWIAEQKSLSHDSLILLFFSIKESVYKCVYQNQKMKLGFKDCSLIPDLDNNTANITFLDHNIEQNIQLAFTLTTTHIYSSAIYTDIN